MLELYSLVKAQLSISVTKLWALSHKGDPVRVAGRMLYCLSLIFFLLF